MRASIRGEQASVANWGMVVPRASFSRLWLAVFWRVLQSRKCSAVRRTGMHFVHFFACNLCPPPPYTKMEVLMPNSSTAYVLLKMAKSSHGAWMWKGSSGTEQADTRPYRPKSPPLPHRCRRFRAVLGPEALDTRPPSAVGNSTRKLSQACTAVGGSAESAGSMTSHAPC